jgi:LysM repeat protein
MKWRDWQLLIILVLLSYVSIGIALTWPSRQDHPAPQPTRTLRPTLELTKSASVTRLVSPTDTPHPTRTPIPPATSTPTEIPLVFTSTPTPTQPTATPEPRTITHTVQKGENLLGIAQRYGTAVEAIVEANDIANPDRIFIGQTLLIPLPAQPPPTLTPSA